MRITKYPRSDQVVYRQQFQILLLIRSKSLIFVFWFT